MSKVMHFISHTHWDREWYMSFEQHRFKLVEHMDTLMETLETNPDFKYFHLDGQIIILDDYLEIKPHMREKLIQYIQEGRLQIGPWYILQDEFLISGEANVRNLLRGIREGRKYGPVCMVGYFPDAFGNISQAPQILKGFGIDSAVFGRGVNPVGSNNTVLAGENRYNSEMIWQSPDGSQVLGVLFANWYHNAMEIPVDREAAVRYITAAKERAEAAAATPHLLMMNGCDHQPVQTNLSQVLDMLRQDFNQDELVHSNFNQYIEEVKKYSESFRVVEGELTSQQTDGWTTLVNTASSRIPIKQMNHLAQNLLEKWAEPLSTMAWMLGGEYRNNFLSKAWDYLMQNHTHDSICGCSVDEVYEEMTVRYKKSMAISQQVMIKAAAEIAAAINTTCFSEKDIPFIVFNPLGWKVDETVKILVDMDEKDDVSLDSLWVRDSAGKVVPAEICDLGRIFVYKLPADSFRKTSYARRLEITLQAAELPPLGFRAYAVSRKARVLTATFEVGSRHMENAWIRVDVEDNGSIRALCKDNGNVFSGLNVFEEMGDIGDEYNFIRPEQNLMVTTQYAEPEIRIHKWSAGAVLEITHRLMLPIGADKQHNARLEEKREFVIKTHVSMDASSRRVDIATEFDNCITNHRLRVLFPTGSHSLVGYADGQFDIVERPIKPWIGWENPSNCQRQQAFAGLHDLEKGLLIANRGLPEYEVLQDDKHTLALTLIRGVAELGDWGEFPTPGAQCLGPQRVEYSIIPFAGEKELEKACRLAYQFNARPFAGIQTDRHEGILGTEYSFIGIDGKNLVLSAMKKAEDRESAILRIYNPWKQAGILEIPRQQAFKEVFRTNLEEAREAPEPDTDSIIRVEIPSRKIITLEFTINSTGREVKEKDII